MRLLVTGGRDFLDKQRLWNALAALKPHTLIHGGAKSGADLFACMWADDKSKTDPSFLHISEPVTPQMWEMLSGFAGNARNQRMLRYKPDLVLACPGNRGTKDMIQRAFEAGIPVLKLVTESL